MKMFIKFYKIITLIFGISYFGVYCAKEPLLINSESNPDESHKDIVMKVKFNQDGTILASGGNDSDIILWDGKTGKYLRQLRGDYDKIFDIAFLDNKHEILTANYQGTVLTWDDKKGIKRVVKIDANFIPDFDFYYPDGLFVVSSWDTSLMVLKINDQSVIKKCKSDDYKIRAIKYSGQKKNIYAGTASGFLIRWSLDNCPAGSDIYQQVYSHAIAALDVNDDLNLVAIASVSGEIKILDSNTLKEVTTLKGHEAAVNSLIINSALKKIISADKDGKIFLWDIKSRDKVTLTAHTDSINSLDISPNNKFLASGSSDRTVKLWNLEKILKSAK